jgi:hypothetical protein
VPDGWGRPRLAVLPDAGIEGPEYQRLALDVLQEVFDLLFLDGEDLAARPLVERKARLARAITERTMRAAAFARISATSSELLFPSLFATPPSGFLFVIGTVAIHVATTAVKIIENATQYIARVSVSCSRTGPWSVRMLR